MAAVRRPCFGCVVPTRSGYVRLCLDGPSARCRRACYRARPRSGAIDRLLRLSLAHPVVNGSGTSTRIAAWRTFGDALLEGFPFAPSSPKTVTLEPRQGNPPPRLWEQPAA